MDMKDLLQHAAWALEELREEVKYQRAEPTEP